MQIKEIFVYIEICEDSELTKDSKKKGNSDKMKATGIVRRIDDLGRVVIPKEIRRTMRIREGDPTLTSLTPVARFLYSIMDISKRIGVDHED